MFSTIGVQISKIFCQNTATEKNVEASFCDNLSTEHLDTRIKKCIMPPCPHELVHYNILF